MTLVTPAMARKWLRENDGNRPLRASVVAGLLAAYKRGEWKITHQGIAFSPSGRLLDGQHRLSFVAELSAGESVPMNVSYDMDESAFEALDIGVKRSMSDIYGSSTELIAVGRFFARIANSSSSEGLTNQFVKPYIDWVEPEFVMLTTFCSKKIRVWSSAPIRAAAIVQMKRGYDRDFIRMAYASLVRAEVSVMPHAARALMQQLMTGKIASARSLDLFVRGLRVFDSSQQQPVAKIMVKDQARAIEEIRAWIDSQQKKGPGTAGLKVAKPSADSMRKAA